MLKKTLLLFLLMSATLVPAQDRIGIAFIPISYDEASISSSDARLIQESVLNFFVSAKKFAVVDREKLVDLENEKKLQKTESFIDSKASVKEGVSKGASCLISTSLLGLRHSEGDKGWETMIQLQIKVLDVSTGEILATENINSIYSAPDKMVLEARETFASKKEIKEMEENDKRLQKPQETKDVAFMNAIESLLENVKKFSNSNFPLSLEIVNWDAKDKSKFVLSSGSKIGIYPGQILDVMQETKTVIGEKTIMRNQKIAVACVVTVEDDQFSEAVIISKEKSFKKAIENGTPLKVVTR